MIELLYFTDSGCADCDRMSPVVARLAGERGLRITTINVRKNPRIAKDYQVTSIPLLLFTSDGMVMSQIRWVGEKKISNWLESYTLKCKKKPGGTTDGK